MSDGFIIFLITFFALVVVFLVLYAGRGVLHAIHEMKKRKRSVVQLNNSVASIKLADNKLFNKLFVTVATIIVILFVLMAGLFASI